MQKLFTTQPALFVTSADLEHTSLQGLDGAEAVLDWPALERIMSGIYASKTGRPSYPLLTLLLGDEAALYAPLVHVNTPCRAADATYSSKETRAKPDRFGIKDRVQRKGYPPAGRALHAREAPPPALAVNAPSPPINPVTGWCEHGSWGCPKI